MVCFVAETQVTPEIRHDTCRHAFSGALKIAVEVGTGPNAANELSCHRRAVLIVDSCSLCSVCICIY